jgi:hypothetical protein
MQPTPPPDESQQGQPAPPPPPVGGAPGPGGQQPSNGLGLAAMIVGIVSIPLVCCFYLGIPGGIVAVILGFLGKQKADRGEATNRGQAMAGIITGAVALLLGILAIVLIVVLGTFEATWTNFDM